MLGDNNKNEPILIYDKSILFFQESYFWRKLQRITLLVFIIRSNSLDTSSKTNSFLIFIFFDDLLRRAGGISFTMHQQEYLNV